MPIGSSSSDGSFSPGSGSSPPVAISPEQIVRVVLKVQDKLKSINDNVKKAIDKVILGDRVLKDERGDRGNKSTDVPEYDYWRDVIEQDRQKLINVRMVRMWLRDP